MQWLAGNLSRMERKGMKWGKGSRPKEAESHTGVGERAGRREEERAHVFLASVSEVLVLKEGCAMQKNVFSGAKVE